MGRLIRIGEGVLEKNSSHKWNTSDAILIHFLPFTPSLDRSNLAVTIVHLS